MNVVDSRKVRIFSWPIVKFWLDEHVTVWKNWVFNGGEAGKEKLSPIFLNFEYAPLHITQSKRDLLTWSADNFGKFIKAVLSNNDHPAL